MKKQAWPWVGTTQHEMGSMSESFKETDQSPQSYDMLVPEKSIAPQPYPSMSYSEGRISPIDTDGETLSLEPDLDSSTVIISDNDDQELLKIDCNLAKTYQQQISGLQVYSVLNKDAGLLFPYKIPKDVLYHMGIVNYPIDIIFINEDKVIKKICKNIQPGSLSTFGCANVKYVLEINGGLSEQFSLEAGNKISFEKTKIKKQASTKLYDMIYAYSFDDFILENPKIILNKVSNYNEDNIAIDIYGQVFSPGEDILTSIDKIAEYQNCRITKNQLGGLKDFLNNSKESYEIYQHIADAFSNKQNLLIFASRLPNPNQVWKVFLSKLENLYGEINKLAELKIKSLSENDNHINLIESIRTEFPKLEICLAANYSLTKTSGVSVPDSTKEQAKQVLKYLELAEDTMDKSLENIKTNLLEYEKLQNDVVKISNTKGQFHQSAKRNIDLVKKYLLNIRDAIKILNKIKDATTTIEIIESLASASQVNSEAIQDIFDLINTIETPEFLMALSEKSDVYDKACEDLSSTIERAKDYINKNILGIIILSN